MICMQNFCVLLTLLGTYTLKIERSDVIPKEYYFISTRLNETQLYHNNNNRKRDIECTNLELTFNTTMYVLCIRNSNSLDPDFAPMNTPVFIYENSSEIVTDLDGLNTHFVDGYVVGSELESSVDGYVENETFYGRVRVGNEIYYVEKLSHFPDIIGENKGINQNKSILYRCGGNLEPKERLRIKRNSYQGNICSLIVVIDSSFTEYVGGDATTSTHIILGSLGRVDTIYRSTDFDGDGFPDNIGFRIKEVYIVKSYNQFTYTVPYSSSPISSKSFMSGLPYFPNFRYGCLGITFTAQPFFDDVVGLSYTAVAGSPFSGGICISGYQMSYNLVVVTYFHTSNTKLSQLINDVSVAHEFGHSFGSGHDEEEPCTGYLMAWKATHTMQKSTFTFSPCSKKQIDDVLKVRSACLEWNNQKFCGNGIIEEEEECDCGSYYNCHYSDHCCLPFDHENSCKIDRSSGFTCHPSQGFCCSTSCTIRDLSHLGLDCKNFQKMCSKSSHGPCGIEGTCVKNHCHSKECTRIELTECSCPKKKIVDKCWTCCFMDGRCIPAPKATQLALKKDPELMLELLGKSVRHLQNNQIASDVVLRFCAHNECLSLVFKVFNVDDYCLFNGKLGTCSSVLGCFVNTRNFSKLPYLSTKSKGTQANGVLIIGICAMYTLTTLINFCT